jgi:uncharacterized membrane-anchored protein
MNKINLTILASLFFSLFASSQEEVADSTQFNIDKIEASFVYQTGTIEFESGNAKVNVPNGFRFLDRKQSIYILTDLWGNPPDSSILGMIVPENRNVLDEKSWLFTISFEEMGYVNDEDDINYEDLYDEMKEDTKNANPERVRLGYVPMEFIGWASAPYYDKETKILHWAKELKFGDQTVNTLNYNLRILGRKGVYVLNAIASMNELPEVKENISKVIGCIEYKEGHRYSDFLPDVDNVAAWTIGGLVAGKVLAKVGFFAVLLKFWKVIALAIAGGGSAAWKYFRKRKKDEGIAVAKKGDENNEPKNDLE